MNVVFHEPWRLVNRLHRDLDHLLNVPAGAAGEDANSLGAWIPAMDILEQEKQWALHADLPGVDPGSIDVTLEQGVLTIRGRRTLSKRDEEHGFRRVERVSGEFFRRFSLPDTADSDSVKASHANGVLEVIIPKQPQVMPRRISVEAA